MKIVTFISKPVLVLHRCSDLNHSHNHCASDDSNTKQTMLRNACLIGCQLRIVFDDHSSCRQGRLISYDAILHHHYGYYGDGDDDVQTLDLLVVIA